MKIIVKKHGYESVQDFMKLYNLSEKAVVQYEYDLKKWEKTQTGNPPKESSVKAKLRKYQEEIGTRKKSNNTKKCSRGDNHGR